MARPLRLEIPDGWYHVMNRGLRRHLIYTAPSDYDLFLKTLAEACSRFQVGIGAYCLMPNHYHLLVHTARANLSSFMRHVDGVYTQRFNRAHGKDGPLFRGRYQALLVEADAYLLQVVRYIHLNPVQANLVDRPGDFRWSSHPAYLKKKSCPDWLEAQNIMKWFAPRPSRARLLYRNFMREIPDAGLETFYRKKHLGWVLGTEDFIERMKDCLAQSNKGTTEVPERRRLWGEAVMKLIFKEVKREFGVKEEDLIKSARGRQNLPRSMALLLARELSGFSLKRIAEYFGIQSYKTVATQCQRFQARLGQTPRLKKQYSKLSQICSQEET